MNTLEIKFRGKRIDNGEWVYGYYVVKAGMPFIFSFGVIEPVLVIPDTIGQFIGLRDKNGKEIYIGDIVVFLDCQYTENGYSENYFFGEVLWDKETLSVYVTNRLMAESYEVLEECEIIGNIHDNSKSLEKGRI